VDVAAAWELVVAPVVVGEADVEVDEPPSPPPQAPAKANPSTDATRQNRMRTT